MSSTENEQLVWLITGTSSGLGKDLTLAALARGDKVIATGRARVVTYPLDKLHEIAKEVVAIYGRIDVIVNNAGYILVGALEENTHEETLQQFNTNVFGALNVTRAFLPFMRARGSGTIVWMGSIGGWRAAPYAGLYSTSKWALRSISRTLHQEIAPLGLRSVCVDFGYFRTSFLTGENRAPAISRIPDYRPGAGKAEAALQAYNGKQPGDPAKGVQVVLDLVHGTGVARGKPFPLELLLGSDAYASARAVTEEALAEMEAWKEVSVSTDFDV